MDIPNEDRTPQVADLSRYPSFVRQGKGTDPYQGVNIRWPNINVVWDGRLGNRLVQRDNNDFGPRLGIAWMPGSKWVVRIGGGMFYNQDTGNPRFDLARNLAGRVRFNPPDPLFPNMTWQNALASAAGALAQVPMPYAFANKYDRRTPYTWEYLVNVQRDLGKDLVFEAGYLGSISHHLEYLRAVNESLPGTVGSVNSRAPYPNFGRIQLVDNGGNANYNSLSGKLTKRYSSGVTLLSSYTFAKSIDESSGIRVQGNDTLFPNNSYCIRCERGRSGFDTAHRFVTSGLWDLPVGKGKKVDIKNAFVDGVIGGWQLGSIVTVQTGFPITVSIGGTDRSGNGSGYDRPNATGVTPFLANPVPSLWFDKAAFALQPAGTLGNAGRGTLVGPGFFTWDFSTHKSFLIHEGHSLQFRWEAFNIMNHPAWSDPSVNANNASSFGVITGTRFNMRQMQLALKYVF